MEVKILKQDGSETSRTAILNDEIFNIQPNDHAIWLDVKRIQANKRRGLASTKERNQVKGSRRKLYRQKGTGRARHGSIRSPIWRGGGITFGPDGRRNYKQKMPKKLRRLALKSALTAKVNAGSIIVLDSLTMDVPKTKAMVEVLNKLQTGRKVLIVLDSPQENVYKSARNIPGVKTTHAGQLNVYDILNTDNLVLTQDAVSQIEEVLA
jgi:large subunit ribosomal protein L4